jgi:hypothetical protein
MSSRAIFAGLAFFFLGSGAARAATVFVQFDPAYVSPVTVDRTVDGGASWFLQDPGQFHFLTQAGSPADVPLSFFSFCIEPREFLSPGQFISYELAPLEQGATNIGGMGTSKANAMRELLGRYYPNFAVSVDTTTGAALQAAIWEIVRENAQGIGSYDLATGDVQYRTWSDTAVRDLAAAMLTSLNGSGPMVDANVQALILAGGTQDILVQVTPEPATFIGMGTGLLLIGFRMRRKRA